MKEALAVSIKAFGQGRREVQLESGNATVGEAIRQARLSAIGSRIAVNGQKAGAGTTVEEGDSLTLVPRVEGG